MIARIQLRRDSSGNWTLNDPILALGEIGYETDTEKFKVGDGVTNWSNLNYELGQWKSDSSGNITYGAQAGEGDVFIQNSLVVTGDLTVNGTTTTINTEEVTIEDNMVLLNSNLVIAPPSNLESGIEVNLGTSGSTKLYWDQATSKWTVEGDLNVQGDIFSNNNAMWTLNGSDIYFDGGNVGIGTSSPSAELDVAGEINFSGSNDSFVTSLSQPRIYRSGDDQGNYPFDNFGHLILQPRTDGSNRDVVFATGTNGANLTVINSDGKVGIGTSTPDVSLHITKSGDAPAILRLERNDTNLVSNDIIGSIEFESRDSTTGSTGVVGKIDVISQDVSPDGAMTFFTSTNNSGTRELTEKMRITADGKVGIGTIPLYDFHVKKDQNARTNFALQNHDTGTSADAQIFVETKNGAGDPQLQFQIDGVQAYTLGIDNSDSDKFKISDYGALGTNDRLVIDSSGNVGIGTTSPSRALHVMDLTNDGSGGVKVSSYLPVIELQDISTNAGSSKIQQDQLDMKIGPIDSNTYLSLNTQNTLRMRIDKDGNVGIGEGSPTEKLDVDGNIKVYGGMISLDSDWNVWLDGSSGTSFQINDNTGVNTTFESGKVGIGYSGADSNSEKLQVAGAIKIGNTTTNNAGTIRWSGTDFEGNVNGTWTSLTSAGGSSLWTESGSNIYYNTGNVGVGTNNPGAKMDIGIGSSNALGLRVTSSNDAAVTGDHISASSLRGDTSAYNLLKLTNSTGTKFIVQGDGKVGIGTTSPSEKLEVLGNIQLTEDLGTTSSGLGEGRNLIFRNQYDNGSTDFELNTVISQGFDTTPFTGDGFFYKFSADFKDISTPANNSNTTLYEYIQGVVNPITNGNHNFTGNITATGTITSSSDITLKENIELISDPIEKVKELSGYTFNKKGEDLRMVGLIAQEVEKVLPEAVHENQEGLKSVAYGNMVALLVECIKKQDERIETLEKTIEKLK